MDALKIFLRKHSTTLDALESTIQAATWLLPDDNNTELMLEGLSAFMGVLGVLRDTDGAGSHKSLPLLRIPPHVLIAILQQTEVLAEVSAKRFIGEELKWSVLAMVEAAKAWGRLHTLYSTGGGLLIENSSPSSRVLLARGASASEAVRMQQLLRALAAFRRVRAPDASPLLPPTQAGCSQSASETVMRYLMTGRTGPGNAPMPVGEALLAAARFSRGALQRGAEMASEAVSVLARGPFDARREGTAHASLLYAGESVHILRPLLYCLIRRRYGRRSWKPFSAALAADLLSRAILTRVVHSEEEKEELRRRKVYLLYYLLYSPAYEVGLKAGMERVQGKVDAVPGLGLLSRRVVELVDSIQGYHTYVTTL